MAILVDTNVLLFAIQSNHPWSEESRHAIRSYLASNTPVFVLPQIIAEFWNVCTRPTDKNGLGLTPQQAAQRLEVFDRSLLLLHENPASYLRWRQLLVDHSVSGVQVHDARIAAAMQTHQVTLLLTYNPRDFSRYLNINPISPRDVR